LRVDFERLRDLLLEIEAHRISLSRLRIFRDWREELHRLNIIRTIYGTTALEGSELSEEEVAEVIARPPDAALNRAQLEVRNVQQASKWIEQRFGKSQEFALRDILSMHEIITSGLGPEAKPGHLRGPDQNVVVGSPELGGRHRGAPGGAVLRRLMDGFCDFINSSEVVNQNPVVRALVAHFYLVTLHPFVDGNGRVARCLESAILYAGDYNTYGFFSLSNFFYRNRGDYFRNLQRARYVLAFDLTEFVQFGVSGFLEELKRIHRYIRTRQDRLMYRELIRNHQNRRIGPRRRQLNEREANLLHFLLDQTRPPSPFSDEAPREIRFPELIASPFIQQTYGRYTPRTMVRELSRLAREGYLTFSRSDTDGEWYVKINFGAIDEVRVNGR